MGSLACKTASSQMVAFLFCDALPSLLELPLFVLEGFPLFGRWNACSTRLRSGDCLFLPNTCVWDHCLAAWSSFVYFQIQPAATITSSSIKTRQSSPEAAMQAQARKVPPACFTDELVRFESWADPFSLYNGLSINLGEVLVARFPFIKLRFQNVCDSSLFLLVNCILAFWFILLTSGLLVV